VGPTHLIKDSDALERVQRRAAGGLQISTTGLQVLVVCYNISTSNPSKNTGVSVNWHFCTESWTNTWRCRWIISIWFCVIDLSEDPLLSRNSRYPAVPQPGSRSPLLQELLLSGIHCRIPPPHWLRYHLSEASSLPYSARRRAHFIATISTRRLAIIIHIQVCIEPLEAAIYLTKSIVRPDHVVVCCCLLQPLFGLSPFPKRIIQLPPLFRYLLPIE